MILLVGGAVIAVIAIGGSLLAGVLALAKGCEVLNEHIAEWN